MGLSRRAAVTPEGVSRGSMGPVETQAAHAGHSLLKLSEFRRRQGLCRENRSHGTAGRARRTITRVRARRSRSKGSEEEGRNVGHFGCPHVGQFRVSLTEHPGSPSGDDVREPPAPSTEGKEDKFPRKGDLVDPEPASGTK